MTDPRITLLRTDEKRCAADYADLVERRDRVASRGGDTSGIDRYVRQAGYCLEKMRECVEDAERYDFAADVLEGIKKL